MSNLKKIVADTYGHCVLCHANMLYEQIIDRKPQLRFSPLYGEVTYLLDDGSSMRVAICKKCQPKMEDTEEEKKYVMECVKEGWKAETAKLVESVDKPDWTPERREKYLSRYIERFIIMKSDKVEKDVLLKNLKKANKEKKEKKEKEEKEKVNGSSK